jgi:hypothetical protein
MAEAAKKPRILLDKRLFCDNIDKFCKHFKVGNQCCCWRRVQGHTKPSLSWPAKFVCGFVFVTTLCASSALWRALWSLVFLTVRLLIPCGVSCPQSNAALYGNATALSLEYGSVVDGAPVSLAAAFQVTFALVVCRA